MNNKSASQRIRVRKKLPFQLFKCTLPTCCNFISSMGDQNRKICHSHQYTNGELMHSILTKIGKSRDKRPRKKARIITNLNKLCMFSDIEKDVISNRYL